MARANEEGSISSRTCPTQSNHCFGLMISNQIAGNHISRSGHDTELIENSYICPCMTITKTKVVFKTLVYFLLSILF